MNRTALSLAGLLALTSQAHAWQTPKPLGEGSPICAIAFNANEGTQVFAEPGNTLTIEFPKGRVVSEVGLSDTVHVKQVHTANIVWLKATRETPPQPISVRVLRDDGDSEMHIFQWAATEDGHKCDLVRVTSPQDVTAAKRAEWIRQRAAREAAEASRALQQTNALPTAGSVVNRAYTLTGDPNLLPRQLAPPPLPPVPTAPGKGPIVLNPHMVSR